MQHIITFEYVKVHVETTSPEELQALFMTIGKMRMCEIKGYDSSAHINIIDKPITIESNTKYPLERTVE